MARGPFLFLEVGRVAEYVHKDGHREHTVPGSNRDRELAAKAADGRTNWTLAGSEPVEDQDGED